MKIQYKIIAVSLLSLLLIHQRGDPPPELNVQTTVVDCKQFYGSNEEKLYNDVIVPQTSGFKSYMSYRAISPNSNQGVVQQLCYTDEEGFRRFNDRYVVAVGTGVGGSVGSYIDLIQENGEIIPAVIGDYKNNIHTDATNMVGLNGCASELIVDTKCLNTTVKRSGDASNLNYTWCSRVVIIRVYDIKII